MPRPHSDAPTSPIVPDAPPVVPGGVALVVGVALGVVFLQSEVASWFRIQEMFRFQSFHMYGIIGSAVATAAVSTWALRRADVLTRSGQPLVSPAKAWGERRGARYWLGGLVFGLGWGLLGACPGPLYALLGAGAWPLVPALASALLGAFAYDRLRSRLPH